MSQTTTTTDESSAVLGMLPYTLLTVAVTLVAVVWKSASLAMLEGLTYYILPETAEEKRRAQLARAQAKASGATRRRKAAAAANRSNGGNNVLNDELGNEDSIAAIRVQKSLLVLRPFWASFDYLVFFSIVVLVNFVAAEVAPHFSFTSDIMKENVILPMLCIVALFSAARSLVKLELDSLTPSVERQLAAGAGVVGFVTSLFFLLLVPTSVVDFEIEGTSRELAPALIRQIRRRVKGRAAAAAAEADTGSGGSWIVSELQIMLGLSVLAGILTGALFAPAVRSVRCYVTCVKPPAWGRNFVGVSRWAVPFLHASFALPLIAAVSWCKPLLREPLGLSLDKKDDEAFIRFRVGVMLVAAASQLAVTPSLVQGFLDGALVVWYELKHGGSNALGGGPSGGGFNTAVAARVRAAMRQKMEITNHIICKVAVQVAAPAVLMLSCGCLLACKRNDNSPTPSAALMGEGSSISIVGLLPSVVWRTVASYLGWWTCASWSIMTAIGIAMAKAGASTFA